MTMKGIKQTTTEIITIEEAIHDYKQAYKDYTKTITNANKFLQNDIDVIKTILGAYFPNSHITVTGNTITITYTHNKPIFTNELKEQLDNINTEYTIKIEKYATTIYIQI